MLFHSYTFLAFLIVVIGLVAAAPQRWRRYILLAGSYAFYASWNSKYALLIAFSTLVDYYAANRIKRAPTQRTRKAFLVLSLATNLSLLGIFKYYNFFAFSLREYLSLQVPIHELLLPVGISFYTFQSMSYTIDVYRRKIDTAKDLVDFALFVSFFPQLVAGPIVRAAEFLPQLARPLLFQPDSVRLGLKLFLFGLFKKVVVADNLAIFVDSVHANPSAFSAGDLWVSAYAFAFQIYYDFSGYSDMAIGLARIFGFKFPENFHRPYCARNVSEFWRRWHISLSSWLRDYLYIPLGGSRGGTIKTARNLMITMVLGGLWHGANWTFLAWGFLHGLFLGVHRIFTQSFANYPRAGRLMASPVMTPIFVLLTFHCWTLSMVLFRASTITAGNSMLARMFFPGDAFAVSAWSTLALCVVLYMLQISQERRDLLAQFDSFPMALRITILVVGFWAMILLKPEGTEPFLYFQF